MEDRVTSDYGNTECNGEDIENEIEKASTEVIKDNIDNQTDEIRNAEEHLEDPKPGMVFDSVDEVMKFYTRYAKEKEYTIDEYVKVGESHQRATFIVVFKDDTKEVNCNCRLFEFRGILCKHQITVFMHRKIDQVPEKYILRRWDKNVKRSHMKVRISYANCFTKPEAH
ncbi:Protein FAR1-RELATED SEQUENCE 1 [Camellia lanceoleosa]|uniref:Protein FAR1-RELATED SEQUENCE 1 n=1 Tax=Camellia lanceoleosa TaxID=1840588 RepID=A0ACC0H7M1_9ERIC|nr:Protein FAR1-RELATED SEQUENCE 1 [Camellia lanceoleosa]